MRTRHSLVALSAALFAILGTASGGSTEVIPYQGRLVDSTGKPREGSVSRIVFRLYSSATGGSGTFVWGEAHNDVQCRRGVFTVMLGAGVETIDENGTVTPGANPFAGEFSASADRYLSVQVTENAGDSPGAELTPFVRMGSVPFAVSAGGSVPVGGIVDWYRPHVGDPVPDGWVICDGSTINDQRSVFNGLASPDLGGKFTRGLDPGVLATSFGADAATAAERLPDTGGVDLLPLGHSHGTFSHYHSMDHTHQIAEHRHEMSHTHQVTGSTETANQSNISADGSPSYQGGPFIHNHAVNLATTDSTPTLTGFATGATGGPSTTITGGPSQTGTTEALSTVDNKPPYVGLLKIMRVR